MNNKRKLTLINKGISYGLLICILLSFNTNLLQAKDSILFEDQANVLKSLGLFNGTPKGFELDRQASRVEGGVIMVRILGKEDEALEKNYHHPFKDVPSWADPYIGYLYHFGYTQGISPDLYGANGLLTPAQFLTFCLRVLNYDDQAGDFYWAESLDLAQAIGIIDSDYKAYLDREDFIYRDDVVAVLYNLLNVSFKEDTKALIDFLIEEDVFSMETALNLNIYHQVKAFNMEVKVIEVIDELKPLVFQVVKGVNYCVILPFGSKESAYPAIYKVETVNGKEYLLFVGKEDYWEDERWQNIDVDSQVFIKSELAIYMENMDKNQIVLYFDGFE